MAKFNAIKYLFKTMEKFESNDKMCGSICRAIYCLSLNESILKTYDHNKNCLRHLRDLLVHHRDNRFCVEMGCKAVVALAVSEKVINEEELDVNVTNAILVALSKHLDSANVVSSACMALSSLINYYEESAYSFLYSESEQLDGIELLKIAYSKHRDESEVVRHICSVFKELCNYDEMLIEMKSIRLNETLINDINKRFRDNANISNLCSFINTKISDKNSKK
jgi:hypothetical protein